MINPNRVSEILKDCYYPKGEIELKDIAAHGTIHGITYSYLLNPEKTAIHKEEIKNILAELSDSFFMGSRETAGGGDSFLNMCMDRHGNHWGEHINCEELYVLGAACGFAQFGMKKEMWFLLPGGMPYICIDLGVE